MGQWYNNRLYKEPDLHYAQDMSKIEYFDSHNIDTVVLPETPVGQLAKNYWIPLVKNGTGPIIENAQLLCHLVKINDKVVPIVVNIESPFCALTSPSCYFFLNGAVAFQDSKNPLVKLMFKGMKAFSRFARKLHFDKTVQINQWLVPTNPILDLNPEEVEALVALLKSKFPDHALVFKGITEEYSHNIFHTGKSLHARFIKMRWLYIWSTQGLKSKHKHQLNGDDAIPADDKYTLKEGAEPSCGERLNQLYTLLYRDKHSPYSPAYTAHFFSMLITSVFFKPVIMFNQDQIDAFYFYTDNGHMLCLGLVGYDTQLPLEHKLYRRCVRKSILTSEQANKPICLGAGSGPFKRNRGAVPINEYDLCFTSHLPWYQQALWAYMSKTTNSKMMDHFIKNA